MAGRLEGKVAIVMGAGSSEGGLSMGNTTAALFAREGAKVFAVDIDRSKMGETAAMIEESGGEYVLHECDVADGEAVHRMAAACFDKWGRVDVLFNNVGIQAVGGPLDLDEEDLDRLIQTNLKGMFYTCRETIPYMLRGGVGSIVNNASVGALRYSYPCLGYMAFQGRCDIVVARGRPAICLARYPL